MNLNLIMKKLQRAITGKGLVIKINTSQFYSEDQGRMITVYLLVTPTWQQCRDGTMKMKDYEVLRTASGIDIVKCLVDIHKAVGVWQRS
jgi:hypothetical protein